jgi:hypothetical protein
LVLAAMAEQTALYLLMVLIQYFQQSHQLVVVKAQTTASLVSLLAQQVVQAVVLLIHLLLVPLALLIKVLPQEAVMDQFLLAQAAAERAQ